MVQLLGTVPIKMFFCEFELQVRKCIFNAIESDTAVRDALKDCLAKGPTGVLQCFKQIPQIDACLPKEA